MEVNDPESQAQHPDNRISSTVGDVIKQATQLTLSVTLSLCFAPLARGQNAGAHQVGNVEEAHIGMQEHAHRFERTACDYPLPAGAHCDQWVPKLTRQLDTRPIVSDIPTLVLYGEYDHDMDAKATQQRITARLKRAYTYTLTGETHANFPVGCHDLILEQFLQNPMLAPDASRIARTPGNSIQNARSRSDADSRHHRQRQDTDAVHGYVGGNSRGRA
jgi:pimeloyl-ACP methyl ester carboxylesterase